jgi:hypothetical protein
MNELDQIQSRFREYGMTTRDIAISFAIKADLANRSESMAEIDRAYWHTVAWRREVGAAFFGVDD